MKIGYARVSTSDQTLDSQLEELKTSGCELFFQEKVSGARRDRPELEKLLSQIRPGDILVVCKLDRLARSTSHLLEVVETLREKNAFFQSIGEPWADTTSHSGKMIMTVFAGIAEFERDLIRERTSRGRKEAKKRGIRFGRPPKMTPEQKKLALTLLRENKSVAEIARTFRVNRSTIYRLEQAQTK